MVVSSRSKSSVRHGGVASNTAEIIEQAALLAFYERGYHGASVRDIAASAGIGLATLFHHFPNKAAVLERIMHRAIDQIQEELTEALDGVFEPRDRLVVAVRVTVLAHCRRQIQSFVAQSELRSLEPATREAVRRKRARVQSIFVSAISDGVAAAQFRCTHPREAAQAIVGMGTLVATWYQADGELTADAVAAIYVDLATRMLSSTSGT